MPEIVYDEDGSLSLDAALEAAARADPRTTRWWDELPPRVQERFKEAHRASVTAAAEVIEEQLREVMKLTGETVVCCDCAEEWRPSCERDGHGGATLIELIEAYS